MYTRYNISHQRHQLFSLPNKSEYHLIKDTRKSIVMKSMIGSTFTYKTTMKATEDIENEFLTVVTQTLWGRHNHLIDETIALAKMRC